MTNEELGKIISNYFLSTILPIIPSKTKLKRKAIEGIIQTKTSDRKAEYINLNEYLNYGKNNEVIRKFINTLEEKFPHCDLSAFYKNIKSLKLIEREKTRIEKLNERLSKKTFGNYTEINNKINIYTSEYNDIDEVTSRKNHELLHLATSRKKRNIMACGFKLYDNQTTLEIGRGLNEGYTEWINCRYVSLYNSGSYNYLQSIAGELEIIVGPKRMQQFFFSNDLDGLIESLEKYTTRENVINLIQKMDKICKLSGKPLGKKLQEKLIREAKVDVSNIMIKRNKINFEQGYISLQQYKDSILTSEMYINGYSTYVFGANYEQRTKIIISKNIHNIIPPIEFSKEEYDRLSNYYFESKKENLTFTYTNWKDKRGKSMLDYIQEKKELAEMVEARTNDSNQAKATK